MKKNRYTILVALVAFLATHIVRASIPKSYEAPPAPRMEQRDVEITLGDLTMVFVEEKQFALLSEGKKALVVARWSDDAPQSLLELVAVDPKVWTTSVSDELTKKETPVKAMVACMCDPEKDPFTLENLYLVVTLIPGDSPEKP